MGHLVVPARAPESEAAMSTEVSSTQTRGLGAQLRLAGQPDLPVTVLARHDASVPYAVRLVVVLEALDSAESFELLVDRGLLTSGVVTGAAGEGAVQVQVVGDQALLGIEDLAVVLPLRGLIELLLSSYVAAPTGQDADVVIALEQRAQSLA